MQIPTGSVIKQFHTGWICFVLLALPAFTLHSQNTTLSKKEADERTSSKVHKVMLIPFEPRLDLSEIDHHINSETHLTPKQIRYRFRDGLNEQLYKAFRNNKFNVVDLMEDTVRYKKDVDGIYQYLAYDYLKVPDQENYTTPKREKEEKKIAKGQIYVETNSDARFMHTRVTDPRVVPLLYAKYKTDLFVFINQLDIRASGTPDMLGRLSDKRKIVVHYTVYTYNAREINSGIVEEEFGADLNNPKKIIDRHFANVAGTIVQRVNKGLAGPVK
jgi:hypothetical protein